MKCAIVYLIQGKEENMTNLKNSLYFLFKNYLIYHMHDIIFFHEKKFNRFPEVIGAVPPPYRHRIGFKKIDFKIPEFIDVKKLQESLSNPPVFYWRGLGYRNMCRHYAIKLWDYLKDYDYYMRLDDDSFIERKIKKDFFEIMEEQSLDYIYNDYELDCPICNEGLLPFVYKYCKSNKITVNFITEINSDQKECVVSYKNNFHVSRVKFWEREDVKKFLREVDLTGNIYYKRWGDAPLHSITVQLFSKRIKQLTFDYSKKKDRYTVFIQNKVIKDLPKICEAFDYKYIKGNSYFN